MIKDLGPHRQPGHGLKVNRRGQRQDDCSVPVSSQTPALAIFIGKSDSMRTRSRSLADCEPGGRLPTRVDQVLDHDRLGVKGEHVSGLHKSSLEAAKSLRFRDVSLHIVCDQGSANHLFLPPVRSNTELTNQKTKAPGKNSHPVNSKEGLALWELQNKERRPTWDSLNPIEVSVCKSHQDDELN